MQKRSLFQMIFGKKTQSQPVEGTLLRLLNGYQANFTPFGDNAYDSDIVRAAVDAIARNAAKLKPKHIRRVGTQIENTNSNLEKLLQLSPNPYMDAYNFYYKIVTNLYLNNNVFIYIDSDKLGNVKAFYPIVSTNLELIESKGEIFVKFHFLSGDRIILPYSSMIHLRRFFYSHDIYGESNTVPLNTTLEVINTTNQGIVNAVQSSSRLRGIIKFTQTMLKDEDLKRQRDRFVDEYLSLGDGSGVAALDSKADFIPLQNKAEIVDHEVMAHVKKSIYEYYGINENIVQSNYNEDQWNAFYESVIEPIAIQMSLEFTRKLFTDREKGFGNEIIFEANRLAYASNTTKINIARDLMPLGVFTINEIREVFNLSAIEGGDKRVQTLNVVDADMANKYQVGGEKEDAEEGDKSSTE